MVSKKDVSAEAAKDLHDYSMLQRFRQSKDLKAVDKYKPRLAPAKGGNGANNKENKWWLSS